VTGCFSLWRPRFIPWPGHMGFVVDRVALWLVLFYVLQFYPAFIIPPMLHTQSGTCHQNYIIRAVDSILELHA
jgi:hypothetical protein